MIASFIVRLMSDAGELLAWTEVTAESKPQGRPRSTPFHATNASDFVIERDGAASSLVIHWHDLDVVRARALGAPVPVRVGHVYTFHWFEPVWIVEGAKQDIPLPPVTIRKPVMIGVPVGGMGAKGT